MKYNPGQSEQEDKDFTALNVDVLVFEAFSLLSLLFFVFFPRLQLWPCKSPPFFFKVANILLSVPVTCVHRPPFSFAVQHFIDLDRALGQFIQEIGLGYIMISVRDIITSCNTLITSFAIFIKCHLPFFFFPYKILHSLPASPQQNVHDLINITKPRCALSRISVFIWLASLCPKKKKKKKRRNSVVKFTSYHVEHSRWGSCFNACRFK